MYNPIFVHKVTPPLVHLVRGWAFDSKSLYIGNCCFTKHPWKTGCFQNAFFYSDILVCFKTTGYWPLDERCAHQSRTGWWCQSCRNVCHAKAETLAASCHISAWRAVSTNINGTQIISLSEFCHPANWTHHWQHMRSHPGSEHSQGMLSVPHSPGFNSPDEAKCLWHKRRRAQLPTGQFNPCWNLPIWWHCRGFDSCDSRFAAVEWRAASIGDYWVWSPAWLATSSLFVPRGCQLCLSKPFLYWL